MPSSTNNVYGMNRRNRDLVLGLNTPRALGMATDKVACKRELIAHGIRVPAPIAELHRVADVRGILPLLREHTDGFVTKPSQGAQGRGVMVFSRALEDTVLPQHGSPWDLDAFIYYVCRILSGEYTVGRPLDAVIAEERIKPDADWVMPGLPGAPDLRVIVHLGKPILAMARLPTMASDGRANLHTGGVGLGIDLETGRSTHAIWKERPVTHHPDSGLELTGREVEGLDECLELAARCARAVPLGYMGVDIMRDRDTGPCVLEVNGRPGLAIQLANRMGLGSVLNGAAPPQLD